MIGVGRRRTQLLDDLRKRRRYWELKEEAEERKKSGRLRWAGHVARMKEGRSASKILTGKPAGERPVGKPRRRWEDNARMNLKEIIGAKTRNWTDRLMMGNVGDSL